VEYATPIQSVHSGLPTESYPKLPLKSHSISTSFGGVSSTDPIIVPPTTIKQPQTSPAFTDVSCECLLYCPSTDTTAPLRQSNRCGSWESSNPQDTPHRDLILVLNSESSSFVGTSTADATSAVVPHSFLNLPTSEDTGSDFRSEHIFRETDHYPSQLSLPESVELGLYPDAIRTYPRRPLPILPAPGPSSAARSDSPTLRPPLPRFNTSPSLTSIGTCSSSVVTPSHCNSEFDPPALTDPFDPPRPSFPPPRFSFNQNHDLDDGLSFRTIPPPYNHPPN
ncbi:hypothetical protein K439DRAFT_1629249, partial [Ramaria rubella]